MKESVATATQDASDWRPPTTCRWSKEQGRAMARAFAASGETRKAFAARHGLKEDRVRWWLGRLADRTAVAERPTFAPVRLVTRAPERRGGVEIVVGAHIVRVGAGFCTETLQQVLVALEGAAC